VRRVASITDDFGTCACSAPRTDALLLGYAGGPGTRVSLCPGSSFQLTGPVVFTAKDQELSTEGYPTDDTRAKLLPVGKTITAVQYVAAPKTMANLVRPAYASQTDLPAGLRGDCRRCARVALRNVQVDGQRPRLGRAPPEAKGGPLVAIGNNEGQVVEHCLLTNPRGWAAVHIREGDNLNCVGARVEHNEIVRSHRWMCLQSALKLTLMPSVCRDRSERSGWRKSTVRIRR